jgi:soluble lytic murein transglycosylase-like protein
MARRILMKASVDMPARWLLVIVGAVAIIFLLSAKGRADTLREDCDRYPFLCNGSQAEARFTDGNGGRSFKPDAALVAIVTAAAWSAGISSDVAMAVVRRESGWRPRAIGDRGTSFGLFQIKCQTARGLGFSGNCRELLDASTNAHWGAKHLAEAKARGGSTCAQITRHNAGLLSNYCSAYGRAIMRTAGVR